MKRQLLFTFFSVLVAISSYGKSLADPIVTMTAQVNPICPGNSAYITITAPPNHTVTLLNPSFIPYTMTVSVGPSGVATFTTPPLYQNTTYTLESIRDFINGTTTNIGLTLTISVIPNGCASVLTDGNLEPVQNLICNPGECRTLTASSSIVPTTTAYGVSSIPYCPQAAFTDPSYNTVNIASADDRWSPPIALPFNFSFFGQNYTSCQVGTNGLITFNPQTVPGFCAWESNDLPLPNLFFPHRNAILGPFQDSDTRTDDAQAPPEVSVNWKVIGTYPCRKLVVNFYHLGQFQCDQAVGLQTSQIVLYELSNIIDVYVQNRTPCSQWQNGDGVIGIANNDGTVAYVPSGRNIGSTWTATNEAWRFTPNGPSAPVTITWMENGTTPIGTGSSIVVCPTATTTYMPVATYQISGVPYTINGASNTYNVVTDLTQQPVDLSVCFDPLGMYTIDLTANDSNILGTENPVDYNIQYFTSLTDAQNFANPIINPTSFSFTQNQTIYAGIESYTYGCIYAKPFDLTVGAQLNAPTGISPQFLSPGQTLADVVVTGDNIQWYDAPQDGNQLPITTVLQNNTSYYATQSVNDCESKMKQSMRLEVIVQLTLNTNEFSVDAFSFYPNPTSGIITLTSKLSDIQLEVFNALGQKIESKSISIGTNNINVSNYASGIYLFQVSQNGKSRTYKIVKN